MRSTMLSPSPIHDEWNVCSCECQVCLPRRFQEGTSYWTSNKYANAMEIPSEHSANSTVSGLPGPGRTLDKYLGIVGRIFEKHLAKKVHDLGFGPIATRDRLVSRIDKCNKEMNAEKREKQWRKIITDCLQLLKYIERSASSFLDSGEDWPLTQPSSARMQT